MPIYSNNSGTNMSGLSTSTFNSGVKNFTSLYILSSGVFKINVAIYGIGSLTSAKTYSITNFIKSTKFFSEKYHVSLLEDINAIVAVYGDDNNYYLYPIEIEFTSTDTSIFNNKSINTPAGYYLYSTYSESIGSVSLTATLNNNITIGTIDFNISQDQLVVSANNNNTVNFI